MNMKLRSLHSRRGQSLSMHWIPCNTVFRLEQSSTEEVDNGSALDVGEENEEDREDAMSAQNSVQSTESIELEMEALKTKVSALQAQLMALMTDRKRLQDLLHQSHKQEFGHLEGSKKQAEEEVLQAQKAVSFTSFFLAPSFTYCFSVTRLERGA